MKRVIGVLVLVAAMALASASAVARSGHTTEIWINMTGQTDDYEWEVGHLASDTPKCVKGRTVKLFLQYHDEDAPVLVDVGRSSKRGSFALNGPTTHDGHAFYFFDRVEVAKKTVGSGSSAIVCKGAIAD
jgi:hypothetical protein